MSNGRRISKIRVIHQAARLLRQNAGGQQDQGKAASAVARRVRCAPAWDDLSKICSRSIKPGLPPR